MKKRIAMSQMMWIVVTTIVALGLGAVFLGINSGVLGEGPVNAVISPISELSGGI